MNVYIPTENITDMRGPCSEGFHIPSSDELTALLAAATAILPSTQIEENFVTYLHIPRPGWLNYSGTSGASGYGYYASSTSSSNNNTYLLRIAAINGGVSIVSTVGKNFGLSIRPFKDVPVVPDDTWTALYSDKIYHNSTLGLISISSDGTNWITIADKNLGATTVYNSGDTMSEANCGKFYQWGNNYGFPFSGATTTSSTKVDASNYGPGNYYSSSTFITSSGGGDWSSVTNNNLRGGVSGPFKMNELNNAYIGEYIPDYLCFTANTAGSTVKLTKTGSPTTVTLETSTDGSTWTTYTVGNAITLSNIGDKVYWRNTSTTDTGFSTNWNNYYKFVMTGSISASGDINYLLNKNSTDTLSDCSFMRLFQGCSVLLTAPELKSLILKSYCYYFMFEGCSNLSVTPKLPATTLAVNCYGDMFSSCTNLFTISKLPATTLANYCYGEMFNGCTKIKLSSTQTGEYQTAYRIPTTGTGTTGANSLTNMFTSTGGTFTGTPSINTTYYTSNTVV